MQWRLPSLPTRTCLRLFVVLINANNDENYYYLRSSHGFYMTREFILYNIDMSLVV